MLSWRDILTEKAASLTEEMRQPRRSWLRHFKGRTGLMRLVTIVFLLALVVLIFVFRHQLVDIRHYARFGYLGIFLINLIGSAALVIPVPIDVAIVAGGFFLNPLLVAVVASTGQVLGEMTGYLLGYSGNALVEDQAMYSKLHRWVEAHGTLTIFILSVIPNPFFNLAGIAAGALGYPLWKFLIVSWTGRVIKNLAYAFTGAFGGRAVIHFFRWR